MEIKVPEVGESITEVTISQWLVEDGDYVEMDQTICEIDSDKSTFELPAEKSGKIKLIAKEGDDVNVGDVICEIDTSVEAPEKKEQESTKKESKEEKEQEREEKEKKEEGKENGENKKEEKEEETVTAEKEKAESTSYAKGHPSPAAAKLIKENDLDTKKINGTGKDGRITKQDVEEAIQQKLTEAASEKPVTSKGNFSRETRKEKMSKLRRTIAKRLVAAKNDTAMLTTFNEADMSAVMDVRKQFKEKFKEKYDVNLGFMSFFTKACCIALPEFPAVNGSIEEDHIVYHDYCDIGIAVSTPRGLVVPVIRNAESLSMAEIEKAIIELATKGRDNKLTLEEMTGGTFTISNGGVFGSLMSTPILNPPQSAILGMHKIEERPVVVNGKVEIRPMMYLAVSYDHRIIDGKESVSFLVRVKELLENPGQMILGKDPVKALLEL